MDIDMDNYIANYSYIYIYTESPSVDGLSMVKSMAATTSFCHFLSRTTRG